MDVPSDRIQVISEDNSSKVFLDGILKAHYRGPGHAGKANHVAAGMQYGIEAGDYNKEIIGCGFTITNDGKMFF